MKMPETIYVGIATSDEDYLDPRVLNGLSGKVWMMRPDIAMADLDGESFVAEYRLVRQLFVIKTTPAPIIEVKEVQ